MIQQKPQNRSRLVAKVVLSLLASEHFDALADLTDALKFRLVALRISYTNDDISQAFSTISAHRKLTSEIGGRHVEKRSGLRVDGPQQASRDREQGRQGRPRERFSSRMDIGRGAHSGPEGWHGGPQDAAARHDRGLTRAEAADIMQRLFGVAP